MPISGLLMISNRIPTVISDAKVPTGRQKPMTEVAMPFAEITTENGLEDIGFSYSKPHLVAGLGLTISDQARARTVEEREIRA
ncbi:hypothetical protein [Saccharopolyspora spinosa]|uniref:Uncharacterized protein n=2 Tax=Saccharopolyspora spinosa TaxID=60894 RepID=A0A2N3XYZ1_SACSN|nr:hypothetical protein [Saccharopolyspora spinosa]PKW15894.1 hypothetical protein A8926_3675 [Saccharopolyspora spinosa]